MAEQTDSWWAGDDKPSGIPKQIKSAYKRCTYQSYYIPMQDSVKLAVDVCLPGDKEGTRVPAVLLQTRYHRSDALRWPFKYYTSGRPVDLLNLDIKAHLLAAGYAVLTLDVRGTGASFGQWTLPWSEQERQDSVEVVDWIVCQPWSNKQVVLYGKSYDATAALFTTARQHPAIKGCAATFAFWDLYSDLSFPGGVPMKTFPRVWAKYTQRLDRNKFSGMPFPANDVFRILAKGCAPVVDYTQVTATATAPSTVPASTGPDSMSPSTLSANMAAASADPYNSPQYNGEVAPPDAVQAGDLPRKARKAAKRRGNALLAEALATHDSWNAEADAHLVRFTDQENEPITEASLFSVADDLAAAHVPLLLITGWLDMTAAASIHTFVHAAKAPGSQLIIGPWTHGGLRDNSPGHPPHNQKSSFYQASVIVDFFNRCCGRQGVARNSEARKDNAADAGRSSGAAGAYDQPIAHPRNPDQPGSVQHSSAGCESEGGSQLKDPCNDSCMELSTGDHHERAPGQQAQLGNGRGEPTACPDEEAPSHCESPVHYFMMGKGLGWRTADSWPPQGLGTTTWFLGALPAHTAGPARTAGTVQRCGCVPSKGTVKRTWPDPQASAGAVQLTDPGDQQAEHPDTLTSLPSADVEPQQQQEQQAQRGAAGCRQVVPVMLEGAGSQEQPGMIQAQSLREGQAEMMSVLSQRSPPGSSCRWEHCVDPRKHFRGKSRYDGMSDIKGEVRYSGLRHAGHLTFTGPPLDAPLEVVGWVGVDLWLESSDTDADVFAYLLDVLPQTGKASYITEGVFRASHRKVYPEPPAGHPRAKARLPGAMFHSFAETDAQPMVPGQAVRLRFYMFPTAYTFPKGHCIRVQFSGADTKNFQMDHKGPRTLWVHTGAACASCIHLPTMNKD